MATNQLTTNFSHTWNGVELVESLFFQPQLGGVFDPYQEFQFLPNVKGKVNIYLPQRLQKVIRKDTGCGFTAVGTTTIDDKTLTPCKVKINLEECEDRFDNTIFELARRSGTDRNDLRGTDIDDIIQRQMTGAVREDNQKLLWFGRDADPDDFYGVCDGFWNILIDSSSSLGHSILMSDDSNIEVAGLMVDDGALTAMKEIFTNQPGTLRRIARTDKRWYVTSTVWDNLTETYEQLGTDSGLRRLEDGSDSLMFRGSQVIDMPEWDDALADSANPFSTEIGNNAILYTTPSNLVIGSDVNDPAAQLRTRYDEETELVRTTGKWIQGVQIVHEELTAIAI